MNKKKQAFCHTRAFWMFVAPAFILFTIFFLVPLVLSIGLSFTNFDGWKKMDLIGLKNYIKILKDIEFYKTMIRTFIYTAVNLPFKVILPLLVAVLVTSKLLKGTTFIRTVVYIPVLLSALVVGITINWMFGQEYGLINFLIQNVGGTPLEWALNSKLATFVISFASNWASIGYFMILFIGGINNIPRELFEAANVDGASKVQVFFKIMLPMLSPTIFIVLLLSTVNLLKEYALIQGISLGGPGTSTTYIIQYMFDQGFNQSKYGYASAVGVIVSFVFIIITIIQFKFTKGGGEV
ncbi:carbohydrate ABC transporter permease [Candidatus Galacturonibacter soehngenii]|uniref:Sugar ABC transporter permease n=1 Tax=Candidatus Galacturonatibacter soehngenii TaxID=2307010 RepID=A0A7V7QJH6_9FIRM|nr:sugar ABC transporter permease [Candidatus Galacturonibacter soehngenii]KAB1437443.1 sugar ABC transporter permease [Candidatus Galacturonibacter soehngenii]MBA4688649.1 sugar ABC transporter permease [Candidatus Galacturonibacter soehngenii]